MSNEIQLKFRPGCPDCGEREVVLPSALPRVPDDFDWLARDFDGYRAAMLEDLAARFPDRKRWTPADMEVVLIEAFAAVMDQLSDQLDRVHGEAYLESARYPRSVRRLLALIGYNPAPALKARGLIDYDTDEEEQQALEEYWAKHPSAMAAAKLDGPRQVRTQKRMVTVPDHAEMLEEHPLVLRAHAVLHWTGSWHTVEVALVLYNNTELDALLDNGANLPGRVAIPKSLREEVDAFHIAREIPPVPLQNPDDPDDPTWKEDLSIRAILTLMVERYRMIGRPVTLHDAVPVGILISLHIHVAPHYYQSEIRRAVLAALGTGPGGFFEPGRLMFGEDLHLGDIIETLMKLPGVKSVCVNRFKRIGKPFPDQSAGGLIRLDGLELAVCDNDPTQPERGLIPLKLSGGRKG